MNAELKTLVTRWRDSGRLAFDRPRLKRISLNGGRNITYADALVYLRDCECIK
jgi:hypothetical protein